MIQKDYIYSNAKLHYTLVSGNSDTPLVLIHGQCMCGLDYEKVIEKLRENYSLYTKYLSAGVGLCILSPVPLIITALVNEADVLAISMTALLLCIVSVGVFMIVRVALINESYKILLQEGDFDKTEKRKSKAVDAASSIYWCLTVAVYLAWSFITEDWKSTWIVWPVAGVLFVPFITVVKHLCGKDD